MSPMKKYRFKTVDNMNELIVTACNITKAYESLVELTKHPADFILVSPD